MSGMRMRSRGRAGGATACTVALMGACWMLAGPTLANASTETAESLERAHISSKTAVECEMRRSLRAIDERHFVVEPVTRCVLVGVHGPEHPVDTVARASRLPALIGRGRSIHQPVERGDASEVPSERAVRWSADGARLSNAQGERSRRAMRGRFVRR